MKLPGTKMKDLPPDELEAILRKVPQLRRYFPSHADPTLDRRVKSARDFLAGERDDDLSWKHQAFHEAQLREARRALGQSQERAIAPPTSHEREQWTPRDGHEFLTREEAAGILEISERDLNAKAIALGIDLQVNAESGQLEYRAADVLDHASALIQKNAVRGSMSAAKKARRP